MPAAIPNETTACSIARVVSNFISRLLEEEGIFYYFDHTATKHTMIFADNSTVLGTCPGQAIAQYAFGRDGWASNSEEGVVDLERVEEAHTGKSVLTDYFFEKPSLNLRATLAVDNEEVFDYPGEYTTLKDGEHYARVRLEELEAAQFVVNGSSRCRSFRPGYNFKLKGHYRPDTNLRLLSDLGLSRCDGLHLPAGQ